MCVCARAQISSVTKDDWQGCYHHVRTFEEAYYNKISSVHITYIYRVIQEESAILCEMIVCVILSKKVHMNMGPILNGYGVTTA